LSNLWLSHADGGGVVVVVVVVVEEPFDEVLALGSSSAGSVEWCAIGVVGDPVEIGPSA
jgi:hypothetical protein